LEQFFVSSDKIASTEAVPSPRVNFVPSLRASSPEPSESVISHGMDNGNDDTHVPDVTASNLSTYAEVAAASPKSLSVKPHVILSVSNTKPTSAKQKAEAETGLRLAYVTGLPNLKVGQLRSHLTKLGFVYSDIVNVSYIGKHIVECILKHEGFVPFKEAALRHGLNVTVSYDPSDPNDHTFDEILGQDNGRKAAREIQLDFIKRIANETMHTRQAVGKVFFSHWAKGLHLETEFERFSGGVQNKEVRTLLLSFNARRKPSRPYRHLSSPIRQDDENRIHQYQWADAIKILRLRQLTRQPAVRHSLSR
jgi:hypothetical protein